MACQPTTSQLHCCFTNLSDFKCINLLEGTIQASYSILVSQAAEVFIHRRQSGYNNIYFKFISTNRLFKLLRCCILFLRKFLMDFPNGFHWERVMGNGGPGPSTWLVCTWLEVVYPCQHGCLVNVGGSVVSVVSGFYANSSRVQRSTMAGNKGKKVKQLVSQPAVQLPDICWSLFNKSGWRGSSQWIDKITDKGIITQALCLTLICELKYACVFR